MKRDPQYMRVSKPSTIFFGNQEDVRERSIAPERMQSAVSRKGIATFLPAAITSLIGLKCKVRYSAWNFARRETSSRSLCFHSKE